MQDRSHVRNVEEVVHLVLATVEELLAKRILLGLCARIVLVKGRLEDFGLNAHLLCKCLARLDALHEPTADIVLAMPLDLPRGLAVKNESNGELRNNQYKLPGLMVGTYLLVLPHTACNIITVTELICETLTLVIKEETTDTTQSLGSQELNLGLRILGVYETSRVNLDLFEVDGLGSDSHGKLLSITSAVVTVGGGKIPEFRTVLLEKANICYQ
jgi:hypothetical protein